MASHFFIVGLSPRLYLPMHLLVLGAGDSPSGVYIRPNLANTNVVFCSQSRPLVEKCLRVLHQLPPLLTISGVPVSGVGT